LNFYRLNKSEIALNFRHGVVERDLLESIRMENMDKLQSFLDDYNSGDQIQKHLEFVHLCAKECVRSDSQDLLRLKVYYFFLKYIQKLF